MQRRGFTMFEMIVTLVCISLLASISYIGFTVFVSRSQSGSGQATLSSFAAEAQSLWIADPGSDWTLALSRAGRDLPADQNWTVTPSSSASTSPTDLVFLVDPDDSRTVGVAVKTTAARNCFALISGGAAPVVWCDNGTATGGEALLGP